MKKMTFFAHGTYDGFTVSVATNDISPSAGSWADRNDVGSRGVVWCVRMKAPQALTVLVSDCLIGVAAAVLKDGSVRSKQALSRTSYQSGWWRLESVWRAMESPIDIHAMTAFENSTSKNCFLHALLQIRSSSPQQISHCPCSTFPHTAHRVCTSTLFYCLRSPILSPHIVRINRQGRSSYDARQRSERGLWVCRIGLSSSLIRHLAAAVRIATSCLNRAQRVSKGCSTDAMQP
ncbi:hypothetical protein BKA81DRAFT_346312 [Phyllosticta paracitricarpa]